MMQFSILLVLIATLCIINTRESIGILITSKFLDVHVCSQFRLGSMLQ